MSDAKKDLHKPSPRDIRREEIERLTAEFLQRGGEIKQIERGLSTKPKKGKAASKQGLEAISGLRGGE